MFYTEYNETYTYPERNHHARRRTLADLTLRVPDF